LGFNATQYFTLFYMVVVSFIGGEGYSDRMVVGFITTYAISAYCH